MNDTLSISQQEKDIEAGTRTLQHEADALSTLALGLNDSFARAVDVIDRMKGQRRGRLIVTGMGKSGHVGRKIAATMASTGTPSYFVHPGEASHGDLGMVTEDDVVLAMSNSGEAPELGDIIAYTRRFGIPLIAITSKAGSTLGKAADITLELPPVGEACPNGLAPTTSTTLTMAMGDALAVALLERMNLTPAQYNVFHPGGKLGKKLMKVSELMSPLDSLPIVPVGTKMIDALVVMAEKNLGSLLVVDAAGLLQGMITDGDIKRHIDDHLLQKSVDEIMSKNPKGIAKDMLAAQAMDIMLNSFEQPITSLVVFEAEGSRQLAGVVRIQACLREGVA
jgi:arabinose-5-phosphate isomerase